MYGKYIYSRTFICFSSKHIIRGVFFSYFQCVIDFRFNSVSSGPDFSDTDDDDPEIVEPPPVDPTIDTSEDWYGFFYRCLCIQLSDIVVNHYLFVGPIQAIPLLRTWQLSTILYKKDA